ncbi:MAG: phosphoribosyltransferase [Bacteroidetes bacterium]|nr:phosphoribosyltransferase [Bacteroidota bacterium]
MPPTPTTSPISPSRILDAQSIRQKIVRIAFEILEDNYDEKEIVIAGICRSDEGYALAERITAELRRIGSLDIHLTSINLDKKHPTSKPIEMGVTPELVDGKVVVIVDDVANTGRTLLYAVKPLLDMAPKKIRVAVLVDRRHKAYPVSPDYVGTSLSTTLHEHIDVNLSGDQPGVFLS